MIICLTETWLDERIDHTFEINGYNKFSLYRNSHGGGIAVYVRKIHDVKPIDDVTCMSDDIEILSLQYINLILILYFHVFTAHLHVQSTLLTIFCK